MGDAFCYAFSENKDLPLITALFGAAFRIFIMGSYSYEKRLVRQLHKPERNNHSLDIKMQATYNEDPSQEYGRDENWWEKN